MSFRDAGIRLIDCVHKTPSALAVGYPYIAIPQMRNGRIDFSDARRISASDFAEWTKKARPQQHDVVLSRRTNPGVTATFGSDVDFALGQNLVLLRADGSHVEPSFLRWLVVGPDWWAEIEKYNNVGAIFDSLKCADVPRFQVPIPPKSAQLRIAEVLASLDEKIELNHRMNETLEAMAKAIFRDWFVDFGPVRRKLSVTTEPIAIMGSLMHDPALASKLAALFPDALNETGLPEGWSERPIGELVEIAGGSTPSTAQEDLWQPAEHRWATPKDLSNKTDFTLFETGRRISSAGLAKITSGLLSAGTVLLSSRAPIGYLAIAQAPVAINQGFIALKPTTNLGAAYLYLWCKAHMGAIIANANGSTFQEISKKNFRPITSPTPDNGAVFEAFGEIAEPMFARIVSNAAENLTLAETRDYLLPRLMSGEVQVTDSVQEMP